MTVGLMSCTTLLLSATESTTKGQLDARVLALLHPSPAQSTFLPRTSSDLGRTAALKIFSLVVTRSMTYHHLGNGDAIKARHAATGAPVGSVADPRTRALLAAKYVAVELMLPTDESILRDKMVPIDRTALYYYVEGTPVPYPRQKARLLQYSHTTTIAISFSVTQMSSNSSPASAT
jgi:hypothetical protein